MGWKDLKLVITVYVMGNCVFIDQRFTPYCRRVPHTFRHEASLCSLHDDVDITKELLVTCVQRYRAQPARGGGGCDMCLAYGGVRYKCVNISSIAVCWSDNTPYTVAGLSLADMNMIIITCPSPLTAPALLALTHWTDLRPDSLLGSKCETL